MLRTPNISSQKLRTPPRGCFFVDLAVLCGVCGVLYSNLARLQGEMRCAREFVVSVVSFSQISGDFRGKRDVRETLWCL